MWCDTEKIQAISVVNGILNCTGKYAYMGTFTAPGCKIIIVYDRVK